MTIEYKDSKRIVGLADVTDSYTTESAFNTLSGYSGYGAEQAVSSAQPRKGIKILSGSSAIGKKIKKVASYLRKNGSPTGTFNFKVYRSGSVISTSADLDPSTLTSSFAQKELTLDTKVTLEADDRIVAEYSGSSSSMAVHMVYNNSANSIASGFNLTQWNGSAWSDSAYDLCFGFDSTPASYNDVTTYKPTNVQDNSLFVEKDTARRYWFTPQTATQQDLTTGTTNAGTNSTIRGFGNQIRSGHAIVGSTLTKVEVSFKTAMTGTATVGVWDSSNNLKLTLGTKDLSTLTGSEAYYTFDTGSVIMQADWIIGFQISGTASNTSVTVRTNGSPDVANVDSYYYHSSNGWNADGATREYNMKIHYTPATTWTMQPTFQDDFTTDEKWVSSDAQAKVDSSGYLLFDEDGDGLAHIVYSDIGRTLDDTKWLWRFKLTTVTFSMNSDPTPQMVHIRISDKTDQRDVASEDAIGMSFRTSDGNQKYIRTTYSDGATFGTTSNFTTQIATGTHYVQITRDSSTQFTVKLYSDSSYSTLVESKSITIPSTITGLRYLKIDNYDQDGTGNGRILLHIDDMEVYSGVTSKN